MAYEKTNWEDSPSTSTPLKAELLNHLENGLASTNDAIDISTTNPSSQTSYYPTFVSTTGVTKQRTNDGLRYDTQQGTTSTTGRATLVLGNGTPSGTAGNKQGRLALHNTSSGFTWLQSAASSSSFVQTLPALTGTVVVKQGAAISTDANGWHIVNMGAFKMYYKSGVYASTSYAGNGWGWLSGDWLKLPVGMTWNNATMAFSGAIRAGDAAINTSCSVSSGSRIDARWSNKYNENVNSTMAYNFIIIDFS